MKVAIVTQPLMANYGGILQNYALQQVLKQLGHEPVTIDWLPTTPLKWYLRGLLRMIVKGVPYRRLFCVRSEPFETFVRSRLNLTPTVRCYRKSLTKGMDALLAGSDQVWRPGYSPRLLPDMFFRFAGDFRGIRMAYAASFGTDRWEASPSLKAQCLRYAKAIHPVSVRERTGIDICRQELGIAAVQMPDPVFLLPAAAYLDLCAGIPRTEEPYIAAYILDDREEVDAQLARTAAESGLPIRRCTAGKDATLSVEEWLALFRDAREVVTDSFHGSVIARLLDKKCTTLCNEQRGKTRFDELNRLGTDLEALRQKGLSFLRDALSHNNE